MRSLAIWSITHLSQKGQVQTECNALRDLFVRTTTALSSSGSQHDRRLNHREAGRRLPPKRTKNVNELQVAVMQWELTLVEHESKFSDSVKTAAMRAMLPKDVLKRFLDGPFQYEELRNREKLAGQDTNGGARPMDIGQIDKSEEEDEDVNRPHDRSNQKHKQESDNERKPFNRRTANSSPSVPRQSTPRDKKPGE